MTAAFSSDPLAILLAHNHWATCRVLELCRGLSDEQFHRSFPIGPGEHGGLHATLSHIIGAMLRWADRIAERAVRPSIEKPRPGMNVPNEGRDRSVDELMGLLDAATAELRVVAEEARSRGLDGRIEVRFGENSYAFTRGGAIVHVLTHGNYHRAQCMNMLRHLNVPGVSHALPDIDVCDWQHDTRLGLS